MVCLKVYLMDSFYFFTIFKGDESGKIIVWNMAPVMEEEAEKNENIPKVLCHMDNHLGKRICSKHYLVNFRVQNKERQICCIKIRNRMPGLILLNG